MAYVIRRLVQRSPTSAVYYKKGNDACFSPHLSTSMPSVVSRFNSLLGGKRKSLIGSSAQEQPQLAQVFLVLISTYHAVPARVQTDDFQTAASNSAPPPAKQEPDLVKVCTLLVPLQLLYSFFMLAFGSATASTEGKYGPANKVL
jgi:hypothetical protein